MSVIPVRQAVTTFTPPSPRAQLYWQPVSYILMAVWCLLCLSTASADTVWLKNGDKISGTLGVKLANKLTMKTSYADEIKINWHEIDRIDADHAVLMQLADGSIVKGQLRYTEAGQVILDEDSNTPLVDTALDEIRYINPSRDLIGEGYVWTGNLSLGGALNSGNSTNRNLQFNGESVLRGLEDRYTVQGFYYWAEDSGEQTQNNGRVRGQYDRFFSKKWYGYVNTVQEKDRFRDIRLRSTYSLGNGYQFYEGDKRNLSLEGGLSFIRQDYLQAADESHVALRWAVNYNQYLFEHFMQAFHRHEVLVTPRNPSQVLLYSSTGLRFPFIFGLSASTQVDYNYDSRPVDDRRKGDTRALFTLGYSWK